MSFQTPPTRYLGNPLARLLIADDDPVARNALAVQLGRDFELTSAAADAEEAISIADQERPDIALLDLQMPAGGGLHATREIHDRLPETAIVILSIDETHDGTVELLSAGAISYLRKGEPVPHGLAAHLHEALRAQRNEP